jgi:hypothetical protein
MSEQGAPLSELEVLRLEMRAGFAQTQAGFAELRIGLAELRAEVRDLAESMRDLWTEHLAHSHPDEV